MGIGSWELGISVVEYLKLPSWPGGVDPDRCGKAAERLETGW